MRVVSRPGLDRYAGPSTRDLTVARWLPLVVPLALWAAYQLGLHLTPLFVFLTSIVLLMSARAWLNIGSGLGILVLLQLLSGLLASALLAANLLAPQDWLFYSAATALMMGYVSFVFNLIASHLPR